MTSDRIGLWFPLLGLAFAVTGADKLFAVGSYRRLPGDLGWSEGAMRAVAAGEVAGGALLVAPRSRRLGGVVLALSSAALLSAELRRHEGRLALPRLALLGAALTALLPERRTRVARV